MAHRKYNWEEWFGREETILVRGVHYHCSQSAMSQTIRNNASARGLRVRLRDTGTEMWIEVVRGKQAEEQAIPDVRVDVPSVWGAASGA